MIHSEDTLSRVLQWGRSAICADVADVFLYLFAVSEYMGHICELSKWLMQDFPLVTKKSFKVGITDL